jgi:mRNA interferase RelE/StbE
VTLETRIQEKLYQGFKTRQGHRNNEQAQDLREIEDLKKLSYRDRYYRIRIGDYRIGLTLEDDIIVFVRFLHRKDLYRYFP